uniref:Uncharacterized protein n=1 Tax=Equus caballus TaxID=9796 RepID=A0A3Q2H747_HORSE
MGEKVSEAPEPVPRGCSGHGARTPAPAAAAASSPGASSAESSSGSETLSEEGEPGGFSREQPPPPPPPGGALGACPAAAWAPARAVLELGVPAPPPPLPGGAAPPAPRGSSTSREEQDEELTPGLSPRLRSHSPKWALHPTWKRLGRGRVWGWDGCERERRRVGGGAGGEGELYPRSCTPGFRWHRNPRDRLLLVLAGRGSAGPPGEEDAWLWAGGADVRTCSPHSDLF